MPTATASFNGDHRHVRHDLCYLTATINVLLDEVGDDETHPLAEVLDYLAGQVKTYEDKHVLIPETDAKYCAF